MAINILMPALSPTMTEGNLAHWLKAEGDTIKAGDVIAEIETDKATMEVEAVDEGVLGRILVKEGSEGVAVNTPIAILVEPGEAVPDSVAAAPAPAAAAAPAAAPAAAEAPAPAAPAAPSAVPPAAPGTRVFASPLARRIAKQEGINLGGVKGTGPNGRIVRRDVEAAAKAPPAAAPAPVAAPAPAPKAAPAPKTVLTDPHHLVPHTNMRKVIARRLTESKQNVPHFYGTMDIELDALLKLRAELNAKAPKEGEGAYKLSVNDLLIKAAAVVLRRIPTVNSAWTDEGTAIFENVDISVAVSIPDGLITPIVRSADTKGLVTISREVKDLAARAKSGKLKPEEFQGGSFTISNMGMFGINAFQAIINPPQSAILAVAAGIKRPVVKGDALAIATVMNVSLSVDHRVIDGSLAAQWLAEFKRVVEDPLSLML